MFVCFYDAIFCVLSVVAKFLVHLLGNRQGGVETKGRGEKGESAEGVEGEMFLMFLTEREAL